MDTSKKLAMNELTGKPCIFITSLGRTGTHFFGTNMMRMIEGCNSVHEPDIFYFDSELYKKIKEFGLFRMTAGKFFSRYSIRGLNIARQIGTIPDDEIVECIRHMRTNSLENAGAAILLESNCSWSSLVDLLPKAFPNARVAYILRDPRSWICSWLNNAGARYSPLDVRSWFKDTRLTPHHIKGDPNQARWKEMTIFDKFCWFWNAENSFALECANRSDSIKVFRFEDIFCKDNDYEAMIEMLEHLTAFPVGFRPEWKLDRELMGRKTNTEYGDRFPEWDRWEPWQVRSLDDHCGDLMALFAYGEEPEWRERLSQCEQ